jgi:hypothetical protein
MIAFGFDVGDRTRPQFCDLCALTLVSFLSQQVEGGEIRQVVDARVWKEVMLLCCIVLFGTSFWISQKPRLFRKEAIATQGPSNNTEYIIYVHLQTEVIMLASSGGSPFPESRRAGYRKSRTQRMTHIYQDDDDAKEPAGWVWGNRSILFHMLVE